MFRILCLSISFLSLFIINSTNSFAQLDTSELKIIEKSRAKFDKADNSACELAEKWDTLTIYNEVYTYDYPELQSPYDSINKLFNSVVSRYVASEDMPLNKHWNKVHCEYDRPATNHLSFKVINKTLNLLSISLLRSSTAGNGGNGSSYKTFGITFDLIDKKELTAFDVLEENNSTIYDVFWPKLDSLTNDGYIHSSYHTDPKEFFEWLKWQKILIDSKTAIIYIPISWGYGSADKPIMFNIEKCPELFKESFLKKMQD